MRNPYPSVALALVAALALAVVSGAEIVGDTSEAITDAGATTVTFTSAKTSVLLINNAESTHEVYGRIYWCGETLTAVTVAAAKIRLEPGESVSYSFNSRTETGIGYCGFSLITDTGDSATIRYTAK
jgi:hypothetical protein